MTYQVSSANNVCVLRVGVAILSLSLSLSHSISLTHSLFLSLVVLAFIHSFGPVRWLLRKMSKFVKWLHTFWLANEISHEIKVSTHTHTLRVCFIIKFANKK